MSLTRKASGSAPLTRTRVRWRPDRDPRSRTFEQLAPPKPLQLAEVIALARRSRR